MHSSYTFDSYWPHAILPCCTSWVCLVTLDLVLMQALSDVAAKLSAHRVPIAAVGLDNHQELCIMSPPVNTRPGGLTPTKVGPTRESQIDSLEMPWCFCICSAAFTVLADSLSGDCESVQ